MYEDITLIFDVDGTLCPIKKMVQKLYYFLQET